MLSLYRTLQDPRFISIFSVDDCTRMIEIEPLLIQCISAEFISKKACLTALEYDVNLLASVPFRYMQTVKSYLAKRKPPSSTCMQIIDSNPNLIVFIPACLQTRQMCERVVKYYPGLARYVAKSKRTQNICSILMDRDPAYITLVPHNQQTRSICQKAVRHNPNLIQYIHERKLNRDICWVAIRHDCCLIRHVPKKLQSRRMCQVVFAHDMELIEFIAERFIGPEMFRCIMDKAVHLIKKIPRQVLLRPDICEVIVEYDPKFIRYIPIVPTQYANYGQAYRNAVRIHPELIEHTPAVFIDKWLCRHVLTANIHLIPYIPPSVLVYCHDLCEKAVRADFRLIEYVPSGSIPTNLYTITVRKIPTLIMYVPKSTVLDIDVYLHAVTKNPELLQYIPASVVLPQSYYLRALEQKPSLIQYVPYDKRTFKICLVASKFPELLKFFPTTPKVEKLIISIIEDNPEIIKNLSFQQRTENICEAAIRKNPSLIHYVSSYRVQQIAVELKPEIIDWIPISTQTEKMNITVIHAGYRNNLRQIPGVLWTEKIMRLMVARNGYQSLFRSRDTVNVLPLRSQVYQARRMRFCETELGLCVVDCMVFDPSTLEIFL